MATNLTHPAHVFQADVKHRDGLSCFSSHAINTVLFVTNFFCIFVPFVVMSVFKMAPKHTADSLSSVSKHRLCDVHHGEDRCARRASLRQKLQCWGSRDQC